MKGLNGIRTHGRYVSAAVLYHLSYEDPYIRSRPICLVHLNPAVKGMTLEDDVSCGNTNFKWRYDRDHRSSLRATRGARNPNLQVVITHASHVCSQHSFILVPRARRFLVKLSRVALGTRMTSTKNEWNAQNPIWSRAFGPSITRNLITRVLSLTWNLSKAQLWTIDRCRPHSVTFGYCKIKTLDTVKIVKSFACSNEQRARRAFGKSE